ncbi:Phosphate carrier protein, mitochondrial [Papilio machaon]|uniref:Phosphate carrier protein, mitochondrial n=1 Tax=Papilio machaon TaxID=76193 RepID=A0A194R6A4_PAPMA|nr:Phosphate carrier protein, mitochondrial [Papilio machaon]
MTCHVLHQSGMAAATAVQGDSCEFASPKYFALCGLGGILSCGITHTAVVPLDLVKCRLQVDPDKYKNVLTEHRCCPLGSGEVPAAGGP